MALDERKYFGTVDYIIFGCTLLLSSIIGVFFAFKHRKDVSSAEYLLANKSISWFPLFVSLVASFFSAVGVMGMPAQIFSTGAVFGLHMISFIIPIVLCAEIFTPIYRRLELVSVNEYLELRFSRVARYVGCLLYHIQYLLYLSIVLFAPSLALNSVAGVPMTVSIISTGAVCTFYTSLGGMRAVIWTDVFQSAVMIIGLSSTAIIGVVEVGSFKKVFDVAKEWGRLDINFSPDPTIHHSFWGCVVGLTFAILGTWTTSQPTVQRIAAAKTEGHAKKSLYMSLFGVIFIMILLLIDALVVFAVYYDCDLLKDEKITQYDQILPYFVVNKLGHLTGIPGLFTACLFSFALSTISSGLNGMSAMFYEDIIKTKKPHIEEVWGTRISRIVSIVGGCFITGFAFIVPKLGKYVIKLTIQLFGIIGGPYFSMFALGMFTRTANVVGVCVGTLIGVTTGVLLAIGQIIYPPDRQLPPISIRGCSFFNATISNSTGIIYPKTKVSSDPIAMIVSVSYVWHGLICIVVTITVGYLVSLCTNGCFKRHFLDHNLLYHYGDNWCLKKCRRKEKHRTYQEDHFLMTTNFSSAPSITT